MSDPRTTETMMYLNEVVDDLCDCKPDEDSDNHYEGPPECETLTGRRHLDTLTTRLEALEAEHEAVAAVLTPPGRFWFTALATAHDNAERVMKGE